MRPIDFLRYALRDCRRSWGRIALFAGCIVVGVAAIVIVAGLASGVSQGVSEQGRKLMAGDVSIEGRRPLPVNLNDIISQYSGNSTADPIQRSDTVEFVSIVVAPDKPDTSLLAELKVVEAGYPLYGDLKLSPQKPIMDLLSADSVVVATEILTRLGIQEQGEILIGGAKFKVSGTLIEEPDKLSISFTLGPRIFLSKQGLARTALMARGARAEYKALLKLPASSPPSAAADLEKWINSQLPEAGYFRVRTFTDAQPALRRSFTRMGQYLGLVGLLSLLVGAVGVAQLTRVWLTSRLDNIAVLRCLGVTPGQVVLLYSIQVLVISFFASLLGALSGSVFQWVLAQFAGGLLPAELINPWQPLAMARGILLGMAVVLVFTLPLLIGLRKVPPMRVLRRGALPAPTEPITQAWAGLLIFTGIFAAATLQSQSWWHGFLFAAGLTLVVGLLAGGAVIVSRLAAKLPRHKLGLSLRHGLAHLSRPGAATVAGIVALGLGVTFVFGTYVIERNLSEQLAAQLPDTAPSTFFLDVQPDQWPPLKTLLENDGATNVNSRPIITARFSAIDGVPVSQLVPESNSQPANGQTNSQANGQTGAQANGQASNQAGQQSSENADREGDTGRSRRWALRREQRLTYGDTLPEGNRVIAGSFPSTGTEPGVSVEEGFANDLDIGIGSNLTLDIQGVPVTLKVTSIRTVDWRTFGLNFFLFVEPGPVDDAPQQRVATARLPEQDVQRLQTKVVSTFPNITLIHIREVMEKILAVLGNLAVAVRFLGLFIIVTGVVVLGGSVAAAEAQRAREVALLKTLGMTRVEVLCVLATEHAITGLVAGIVGTAGGLLLAWAVATGLMEIPWQTPVWSSVFSVLCAMLLSTIAGLGASLRTLGAKPIEVLRAE